MKIGILTYHCVPNFGAQLQALSTVGFFRKMGYEPIVLNWYPCDLEAMYRNGRIPSVQMSCHKSFTQRMLPISKLCRTEEELVSVIDELKLDAIFLGSDALFKYRPQKEVKQTERSIGHASLPLSCERFEGNPFFGQFLSKLHSKTPAAVYAVSSQDCRYKLMKRSEKKQFALAFNNFCFISARDEWTRGMVAYITGKKDVKIFPDPVFGFNYNVTSQLIPSKEYLCKKFGLSDNYVLISFSKHYVKEEYVKSLAVELQKQRVQPVALPLPELLFGCGVEKSIDLPLDPLEWYALIVNSKGFIGERMHPIIVCLHNNVPFYCFDEYGSLRSKYFARKKFWVPKYYLDWRTSKTYHIIKKANLLENWYSYSGTEPMPEPINVVSKVLEFDTKKCEVFSEKCYSDYVDGMNTVVGVLKEQSGNQL